jgi:hypothetical protein
MTLELIRPYPSDADGWPEDNFRLLTIHTLSAQFGIVANAGSGYRDEPRNTRTY